MMVNMDEQISKNFTMREMCYSYSANRHCIKNEPNEEEAANIRTLVNKLLQPLRDYMDMPLLVTSGFRTQRLNGLVGGAKNSFHMKGCAADIAMPSWKAAFKAAAFCSRMAFTEVILSKKKERIWLHVAYDASSRKQYVAFKQYN
jgi:uncharacterized protein YcbK (DUF882 family)